MPNSTQGLPFLSQMEGICGTIQEIYAEPQNSGACVSFPEPASMLHNGSHATNLGSETTNLEQNSDLEALGRVQGPKPQDNADTKTQTSF